MNKIAVWGGGIIAMLSSLMLKKQGYEVFLCRLKSSHVHSETRRWFALNHLALKYLSSLDIDLHESIMPVDKMHVWENTTGAAIELQDVHPIAYMVDEKQLWQILMDKILVEKIHLKELEDLSECQHTANGWSILSERVDFLVIADGAKSPMRMRLKVPCKSYSYDQKAIVAQVKVRQPHQNIAKQVFTAYGPLAFLPTDNLFEYSMVWSLDNAVCDQYLSMGQEMLIQEIDKVFDGQVGQIEALSNIQSFPLQMIHANHYYGKNWLIIGDAAHQFHPLAGLGLNVGIGDVYSLSLCLQEYQDIHPVMLAKYQRIRKGRLVPLIQGLNLIKKTFAIQNPILCKLRNMGMDLIDQSEFIKKIMRHCVQEI